MQHDITTQRLLSDEPPTLPPSSAVKKRGRPRKPDALSDAERARRYRARKKARQAELQEAAKVSQPPAQSAAPWRRCWEAVKACLRKSYAALRQWLA